MSGVQPTHHHHEKFSNFLNYFNPRVKIKMWPMQTLTTSVAIVAGSYFTLEALSHINSRRSLTGKHIAQAVIGSSVAIFALKMLLESFYISVKVKKI